ncbi:hypothetical protein Q2T42_26895 [Leptolyngbya boryana CZ1]|uniref:Uncharacterized protein n=1 Tax=Leptolyngbya boryana CZ1 TaxID=3060204 RepID=A0AA96WTR8_LEPBY|nr:hypothetical protein [Leptolyngbya boryana]WNZ45422.1 hypothetical protein Q2T42_26895 [Leptolyngbya boryana CZ1]
MNFRHSLKAIQAMGLMAMTAATMTATHMTTNVAPSTAQTPPPRLFQFINKGLYVARYQLSYTVNGRPVTHKTGDVVINRSVSFRVPGNATDIRTEGILFTGLFNETRRVFFHRFPTVPQNTCFTTFGTTLHPQQNQDCRL